MDYFFKQLSISTDCKIIEDSQSVRIYLQFAASSSAQKGFNISLSHFLTNNGLLQEKRLCMAASLVGAQ